MIKDRFFAESQKSEIDLAKPEVGGGTLFPKPIFVLSLSKTELK
jgi:hypothetical protein